DRLPFVRGLERQQHEVSDQQLRQLHGGPRWKRACRAQASDLLAGCWGVAGAAHSAAPANAFLFLAREIKICAPSSERRPLDAMRPTRAMTCRCVRTTHG